jgi:hypothetical protein
MKFRFVFWDVLPYKIIVDRRSEVRAASIIRAVMEAARTSETSVDNYFTRQYIPEDKSELHTRHRENLKISQVSYDLKSWSTASDDEMDYKESILDVGFCTVPRPK